MIERSDTCHVISHVHWDREWYRGFDGYRGRLVDLVERVCDLLDDGTYATFHLDGQTVVLADVLEIRPDLEPRLSALIAADRLTVGPWHVLADNQLVSAENLVRNLFRARRWGHRIGRLSTVGYSPDAFGHPADLPRLLVGFGMDTALVWRGAPPELARFRWRAPDGSEVFTVNQSYHQTEVLWDANTSGTELRGYVDAEKTRLPDGPWLLLNGGDHLVPQPPSERRGQTAGSGVELIESTLASFFAAARESTVPVPVVSGELRRQGNRLTFLLPGTLSARTYIKLANERVQTLLERFVEPQLARAELRSAQNEVHPSDSRSLTGLLDHAWDLVIKNSPHDSICGCSIDEVHRTTTVRAERAVETGELLVHRMLLSDGLDTRRYGTPPAESVALIVLSGHGDIVSGPVMVEVATDPSSGVIALFTEDGREVPFEVESTRIETVFEADLDLLPDSRECAVHRVAFSAADVPPFGWKAFTARLGAATAAVPESLGTGRPIVSGRFSITVNPDASVRIEDRNSGVVHDHVGRLVSSGDRGDSYNYDPPANDSMVEPIVSDVRVTQSEVRTRIAITASLQLPISLSADRDSRSTECVAVPLTISIEHWGNRDQLDWAVTIDNTAGDHRLRFELPIDRTAATWTADQHWSALTRPIGPELGALPVGPALEAESGVAPVHSWASVGTGATAVALLTRGLPEVQAYTSNGSSVLAVTVLRAVGWMSRFDLRTRTTGAGPMLAVPEAQCRGSLTAHLSVVIGTGAEADHLGLPQAAALHRVPLEAFPLRPGCSAPGPQSEPGDAPRVAGALVSAWKPVDQTTGGGGSVLRISNPTAQTVRATVTLPIRVSSAERARLDETVLEMLPITGDGRLTIELGPFGLETLILRQGVQRPTS